MQLSVRPVSHSASGTKYPSRHAHGVYQNKKTTRKSKNETFFVHGRSLLHPSPQTLSSFPARRKKKNNLVLGIFLPREFSKPSIYIPGALVPVTVTEGKRKKKGPKAPLVIAREIAKTHTKNHINTTSTRQQSKQRRGIQVDT